MHAMYRRLDPKHRRLLQLANLSLVLGLMPWIFRAPLPRAPNLKPSPPMSRQSTSAAHISERKP